MMDIKKVYTELFEEETRLCQDNASSIEFLTNKKVFLEMISKGSHILELGAATGRYTVMLADEGYRVTALEYVQENLDVLKRKCHAMPSVTPVLGDAMDLSRFPDETFDAVLNMGPLYHLSTLESQDKVVKETMRVLKKDGLAFFAFINHDAVFVTEGLMYNKAFLKPTETYYDKHTHKIPNTPFTFMTVDQIKTLMARHGLIAERFIASDAYAELLAREINALDELRFKAWMDFNFYMHEKPEVLAVAHHLMYCTKKG